MALDAFQNTFAGNPLDRASDRRSKPEWIAEQLAAEAERELQAERSPRRRLKEAERQFELGAITVEEYEAIEDELLAQLDEEEP